MMLKVVKQFNPIGAMELFTKPNCNLCIDGRLTIFKKLRDKNTREQKFGDIRGLPAQNYFPLILPKH